METLDKYELLFIKTLNFLKSKFDFSLLLISNLFLSLGLEKAFWNSQQDAQEIFLYIFDTLNQAFKNNKNNFTSLVDLFEGKLENTIFCVDKDHESKMTETFVFLQVDLEVNKIFLF